MIETITDFNALLTDDNLVAIRLTQRLAPITDTPVIFPPTYANIGYDITTFSDGTKVVTIDSIPSQANRLEPLLYTKDKQTENWLVPPVTLVFSHESPRIQASLLEIGHRAADAIVLYGTDLGSDLQKAFKDLQHGNAYPLACIAPTSLLFGFWDSRGTGQKRPRILRAQIRAWDIEVVYTASQYRSVWEYLNESQRQSIDDAVKNGKKSANASEKKRSAWGLADVPNVYRPQSHDRVLGGVWVRGRLERDVVINLIALRALKGADAQQTNALQRYLLGLALWTGTQDLDLYLREGCLLRYADPNDQWMTVPRRGDPRPVEWNRDQINAYAQETAAPFRTEWPTVFGDYWPHLEYPVHIEGVARTIKNAKDDSLNLEDDPA